MGLSWLPLREDTGHHHRKGMAAKCEVTLSEEAGKKLETQETERCVDAQTLVLAFKNTL